MPRATTGEVRRAGFPDAVAAQAALLLRSRRPGILLLVVAIVLAVAVLGSAGRLARWSPADVLTPGWYTLFFLLGAVWGVLVWHDEGPEARWYHWSMPLDASLHDAARVLAGAAWLAAALALFLAWVVAMAAIAGRLPALLRVGPLAWAGFVTSALLGYLFLAALGTLTKRALEAGLLAGVVLLVSTFELAVEDPDLPAVLEPVRAVLDAVFLSDWGLLAVLHDAGARARLALGVAPGASPEPPIGPGAWVAASSLWLAVGIAAVLGAALWHRRR